MLRWFLGLFRWFLNLFKAKPVTDDELIDAYSDAGAAYGDAVSYLAMGSVVGIREMRTRWSKLEREYAARGYQPVEIQRFINYGGYGKDIDDVIKQPLDGDPTLYDPIPPKAVKIEELTTPNCEDCNRELADEDKVFCPSCLRKVLVKPAY